MASSMRRNRLALVVLLGIAGVTAMLYFGPALSAQVGGGTWKARSMLTSKRPSERRSDRLTRSPSSGITPRGSGDHQVNANGSGSGESSTAVVPAATESSYRKWFTSASAADTAGIGKAPCR